MPLEAFFLPSDGSRGGQRFCLLHTPVQSPVHGAIVYVHPFAEEMNKSRRMAGLQSHALAKAGYAVLQIDLLGCGDSSGDFGDASWDGWIDDVVHAAAWLRSRVAAPLWLWGLRAGCLLAAQAAQSIEGAHQLLLWQPVLSGRVALQQFLRLKLASVALGGQAKGVTNALHTQLAAGKTIEVAGYGLSPALAGGLEGCELQPAAATRRVVWLEVSARDDATLLPASQARIAEWQAAGIAVQAEVVQGPTFWQTTEIEDAPSLVDATLVALCEVVSA